MHALLEEWSDWMRAGGSADSTIRGRTLHVGLLCKFAGVDDPVSLTTMDVARWLGACRTRWTRCTYATSARAWHRWLVDRGYREDNPTAPLPIPKEPRSTARPASSEAIRNVLPLAGRRGRPYIVLATFLGLRVHEVAKVRGEEFADGWYFVTGKGGDTAPIPTHPMVEHAAPRASRRPGYWFRGRLGDGPRASANAVSTTAIGAAFRPAGVSTVTAHHAAALVRDPRAAGREGHRGVTQRLMRHADAVEHADLHRGRRPRDAGDGPPAGGLTNSSRPRRR
jgi:integrase/recombinase XerD